MFGAINIAICIIAGHDFTYFTDDYGRYRICDTCDHKERL